MGRCKAIGRPLSILDGQIASIARAATKRCQALKAVALSFTSLFSGVRATSPDSPRIRSKKSLCQDSPSTRVPCATRNSL